MEKLNFNYEHEGKIVASFDSDSQKFKDFIHVAIAQLQQVKHLKGHVYDSTLSPHNKENFEDDMRTFVACDLAIRVLEDRIGIKKKRINTIE